jgi:hypothetical protein
VVAALADSLGDAYIEVHADTDPFRRELPKDLDKIGKQSDALMEKVGENWGKHLGEGTRTEIRKQLPGVIKEFEKGARAAKIKIDGDWFRIDRSGRIRDLGGRFVEMFREETEKAFNVLSRPGGPFSQIGEGLSDAIGAGFNVSGKSPLISVLAIAVGGLVGVILAAVQAANALVAVLATIPALIGAIGLQAGVLMLAFDGMGKAIQGAFAAKNAHELLVAMNGLAPSAKDFVRSLLPVRDFFKQIKLLLQENFFAAFGNSVTKVFQALEPVLRGGLPQLATSLGFLFRQIALFFASPTFKTFLETVIPATLRWLGEFTPSLTVFLKGLIAASTAAIPFLERLGRLFNQEFKAFGQWLSQQVSSGKFQEWLDSMVKTLNSLFNLFDGLVGFVKTFMEQLDKAGGKGLIDELVEGLNRLIFLLESPAGQKFFEGLVFWGKLFIDLTFGLIYAFVLFTAGLQAAGEAILAFFEFLGGKIIEFDKKVLDWVNRRIEDFKKFKDSAVNAFAKAIEAVADFFRQLPGRIGTFVSNIARDLWNAGINAGRGLINAIGTGIENSKNWLISKVKSIVASITAWLPGSPAQVGPLSGSGYALYRGQALVKDLAAGMESQVGVIRTASAQVAGSVFNTNLNFYGQQPTEAQATTAGRAVAGQLESQIAMRDMRLAVRTM